MALTEFTEKKKQWIFLVIFFITPIPQLLIDMYLPALPGIQAFFNTTALAAQLSLPFYLIPYSISIVFFGILSDSHGRKISFLISIIVSFIGLIVSACSGSITFFLAGRAIQGIGIGACSSVVVPVLMDIFEGKELLHKILYTNIAYGVAPIVAPYLGGVILTVFDWQMIFVVLAAYAFILFIFVKTILPETNRQAGKIISPKKIFKGTMNIVRNANFMILILVISCPWGFVIVFNIIGPFIFQSIYKLTPYDYGIVTLFMGVANILGVFLAHILVRYIKIKQIISLGIWYFFLCAVLFGVMVFFIEDNVALVLVFSFLLSAASGIIFGGIIKIAFAEFSENMGLVSSLFFSLTNIAWALISYIVSIFSFSVFNLAVFALILAVAGIMLWSIYSYRSKGTIL